MGSAVRLTTAFLLATTAVVGCSKHPPPPPGLDAGPPAPTAAHSAAPRVEAKEMPAAVAPAWAGPWNVILVSIDSLRADMPWAGYPRPIAPHLAALYAKSVAYAHAYSTSSFTSKSIPGLLTGKFPSELDRSNKFFTFYYGKSDFFCTSLAAEGIPCVGAHAHAYFGKGQSGFENGFRKWEIVDGITFDYQTDPYVTSQKLTPLAITMLEEVSASPRPFFAWFHYMDAHDKYNSHEESPHFGDRPRDLYDEEVFYTDLWIGKLLDFVDKQPWAPHTVIAVTADHGEAFGEHNLTRHGRELWEELVHVPLFFYVPGAAPRVIDTPRGHADVAPTILELLGAKKIDSMHGTSLVSELHGGKAAPRDVIVDLPEDDICERRRALIHDRWKIIAFGDDVRFSLFDLEEDPHEATDLYWKRRDVAQEMHQRYLDAGKAIHDVEPRGGYPSRQRDH
jgi:choline-sulfatase